MDNTFLLGPCAVHREGFSPTGNYSFKKKIPRAVDRSYFKRLVVEDFRKQRLELPPWDYLLYVHRDLDRNKSADFRRALGGLWKSLKKEK